MTLARPRVVSQTEWDVALAAMTERAQRWSQPRYWTKPPPPGSACRWCGSSTSTASRVPAGSSRCGRSSTAQSAHPLSLLLRGGVEGWPHSGARAVHRSRTASPTSVLYMLATSPSPWRRRHRRRIFVATPSAWLDRRSLVHDLYRAFLGRLRSRGVVRLNVFLRDGDDVYRTYFLQHGRWFRRSAAFGASSPSRLTAAVGVDEDAAEAGHKRRLRSGTGVTTSTTIRRPRPPDES